MPASLVFPVQVLLAFVTFGLLARWYVAPRLRALPLESALQPLLAVQTIRYIGLVFLAPATVSASLPPSFAVPAGIGTAVAGVLALVTMGALRARSSLGVALTWLVTVVGVGDFANAFVRARGGEVIRDLGAAYYVPIVIVPVALVSHVMIIALLLRRRRAV